MPIIAKKKKCSHSCYGKIHLFLMMLQLFLSRTNIYEDGPNIVSYLRFVTLEKFY